MRPLISCSVAKLALPMTRLNNMRPATATSTCAVSSSLFDLASCAACRSAASALRRKSLGYALPRSRKAASLARRSAMIWFSSSGGPGGALFSFKSDSLLQACRDEIIEVAVEHRLRAPHLVVRAQVLDPRLVEHVRADLVPPADVGFRIFELLLLGLALADLELVELGLEHGHRFGAIAVLRAIVLALHDDVGRQMGDAHRGIGLVDVLAAGARRAEGVDAKFRRIDLDVDGLVDFGIDKDAGKGSVPARVGIERALAHQAMHAGLGAQIAIRVISVDLDARALDPGDFTRGFLENFRLIALALAVAEIHPQQHRGPVLCFGAAASGLDVDEARVGIHRIVEHPAEFHVVDDSLERCNVACQRFERRVVALASRELEQLDAVLEPHVQVRQRSDHAVELLLFLAELLRPRRLVPDLRILELPHHGLEARRLHIEVKDTSANRRRDAEDRSR